MCSIKMESMISTNNIWEKGGYSSGDDEEESSWSFYLEDFCKNNTQTAHTSLFSASSQTSSSVASVINHATDDDRQRLISSANKRRKTQSAAFVDHDLEDTASSPHHTPNLNKFCIFQKPKLFQELHKQQQGGGFGGGSSQGEGTIKRSDDTAELRRKGLCLVPLSIFVDYYVS